MSIVATRNQNALPNNDAAETAGSTAPGLLTNRRAELQKTKDRLLNPKKRLGTPKGDVPQQTTVDRPVKIPYGLKKKADETGMHDSAQDHEDWGIEDASGDIATGEEFMDLDGGENEAETESDDDAAEVQENLARGRAARHEVGKSRTKRPAEIEKIWLQFYMQTKLQWSLNGKEMSKQQKKTCDKLQEDVDKACLRLVEKEAQEKHLTSEAKQALEKKYKKDFTYPTSHLWGLTKPLAPIMENLEIMDGQRGDDPDKNRMYDEEIAKMLAGVAAYLTVLKQYDILPQYVIGDYARETFDAYVNSSVENQRVYKEKLADMAEPTLEQKQAWVLVIPQIEQSLSTLQASSMSTDEEEKATENAIARMEEINVNINKSNELMSIDPLYHTIPTAQLRDILKAKKIGDTKKLEEGMDNLWQILTALPRSLLPLPNTEQNASTAKQRQIPSMSGNSSNVEPTPMVETSSSLFVPETGDVETWTENDFNDVVEMFDYSKGITEFGPVIGVRLTGSDNLKYSRFIVNSGFRGFDYPVIVRGSELGPGGAEALSKLTKLINNFDLNERKRQLKKTPALIKQTGPVAIMQRADGYKPKAGCTTRHPDTCVKLTYSNGEVEWPTMTDYIKLVGASYGKKKVAELTLVNQRKGERIKICRERKLNPINKQPLTPEEIKALPWHFPSAAMA